MGKESKEGGGGGGVKEHKKEGKGTAGGEGGVPPTMSGKSLQPSPTSREFVFFPQLLRGENEPANPPVRCWALCPGGEEQERPECRPVGVCVCTESRATIALRIQACNSRKHATVFTNLYTDRCALK